MSPGEGHGGGLFTAMPAVLGGAPNQPGGGEGRGGRSWCALDSGRGREPAGQGPLLQKPPWSEGQLHKCCEAPARFKPERVLREDRALAPLVGLLVIGEDQWGKARELLLVSARALPARTSELPPTKLPLLWALEGCTLCRLPALLPVFPCFSPAHWPKRTPSCSKDAFSQTLPQCPTLGTLPLLALNKRGECRGPGGGWRDGASRGSPPGDPEPVAVPHPHKVLCMGEHLLCSLEKGQV